MSLDTERAHAHACMQACSMHAGVYKTLANIFISFLGAGILTLPHAFMRSGIVVGVVVMLVVPALAYVGILLLVDCKRALEHKGVVRSHHSLSLPFASTPACVTTNPWPRMVHASCHSRCCTRHTDPLTGLPRTAAVLQSTYSEVAEAALGPTGKTIVEIFLVLSQAGFCVAYIIFIFENLPFFRLSPGAVTIIVLPLQVRHLERRHALASFSLTAFPGCVC
jgi:solute carrier family 36 (proton-coupled amino acid transporter)